MPIHELHQAKYFKIHSFDNSSNPVYTSCEETCSEAIEMGIYDVSPGFLSYTAKTDVVSNKISNTIKMFILKKSKIILK